VSADSAPTFEGGCTHRGVGERRDNWAAFPIRMRKGKGGGCVLKSGDRGGRPPVVEVRNVKMRQGIYREGCISLWEFTAYQLHQFFSQFGRKKSWDSG